MPERIAEVEFYEVEELAKEFGAHPETVRRYIRQGKLKAKRFGKEYKIPRKSILKFFELEDIRNN